MKLSISTAFHWEPFANSATGLSYLTKCDLTVSALASSLLLVLKHEPMLLKWNGPQKENGAQLGRRLETRRGNPIVYTRSLFVTYHRGNLGGTGSGFRESLIKRGRHPAVILRSLYGSRSLIQRLWLSVWYREP